VELSFGKRREEWLVVSITLRDLGESPLKALDEFFRQAAAQFRRSR
jgi:hypothetical protein